MHPEIRLWGKHDHPSCRRVDILARDSRIEDPGVTNGDKERGKRAGQRLRTLTLRNSPKLSKGQRASISGLGRLHARARCRREREPVLPHPRCPGQ